MTNYTDEKPTTSEEDIQTMKEEIDNLKGQLKKISSISQTDETIKNSNPKTVEISQDSYNRMIIILTISITVSIISFFIG